MPAPFRRRAVYASLSDYFAHSGDTQEGLAKRCGSTQSHISRIATGQAVPRPELAARIAQEARVPLDSFVREHLAYEAAHGDR